MDGLSTVRKRNATLTETQCSGHFKKVSSKSSCPSSLGTHILDPLSEWSERDLVEDDDDDDDDEELYTPCCPRITSKGNC